jgi:KamA family protein
MRNAGHPAWEQTAPRLAVHRGDRLADLPQMEAMPADLRRDVRVVAQVLPFKVNDYVLDHLIDWDRVPDDPIYRLTFPHRDMLDPAAYARIAALVDAGAPPHEIRPAADEVRWSLNPHPGGQLEKNVPHFRGEELRGLQHKYLETVLFFPAPGQTCHSYCGYCFRWAQFVGMDKLRQANRDAELLADYLRAHPMVTDVLFTGGDPMIMSTRNLEKYVEPLLTPELEHVQTLRIGTKALSYWPHRFVTDRDADDFLRLLERCVDAGKHVSVMAHFTHAQELRTEIAKTAIRRILGTGAVIRTQSPIVRHVNDDGQAWADLWREQVRLGCVPYYMFVERDTGAKRYYGLPLAEAHEIYRAARNQLSGLGRTARGPSMSADPGKVVVDGVATIAGKRVFCLRMLQGRNPDWVGRPFFAAYDPAAEWLDDLRPAFGDDRFFFEADPIKDWRHPHASERWGDTNGGPSPGNGLSDLDDLPCDFLPEQPGGASRT